MTGMLPLDDRTLLTRWREQVVGTEPPTLGTALGVAERAGGRYAVTGSVITDGPDLVLTAGVYEVAARRILGTARSRGPADSIFTLVDHLTLEILRLIPEGDARELARIDLARVNTASLPALKAFLEGEARFRRSQFESAAEAYGRAVEADSTFALARYRLGLSRQWFWSDMKGSSPDPLGAAVGRFAGRLPPHEAAMFRAFLLRDRDTRAARDLLEEEARRHPEDVDTWYQLGEFYHHSGDQALVPPGAADRALARAIALDSTFSLPYIHRVKYAIGVRDTAGAHRLIRTFARLAPETPYLAQLRLLAGFALGDPIARSTTEATFDTLEIHRLFWLALMLAEAHRWELSEQVLRKVRNRGELRPDATMGLFFVNLAQGKAHEAHRWLDDPFMPEYRKAAMLQALADVGTPGPAVELDATLALDRPDSADAFQLFYIGSIAASRARWQILQGSLERLRVRARSLRAAGDSSEADFTEAVRQGLEGYVWWRQGQRDHALRLLQGSQRRAIGSRRREALNASLRWWLGRLLVEMGRPREALPYFESLTGSWLPADYERGRLYEQLGMAGKARGAYALFLGPRQQADSVFQPMIQDARAALERLAQVAPE
jgi:tetratricopeptide (TPR) repeat protein